MASGEEVAKGTAMGVQSPDSAVDEEVDYSQLSPDHPLYALAGKVRTKTLPPFTTRLTPIESPCPSYCAPCSTYPPGCPSLSATKESRPSEPGAAGCSKILTQA